MICPAAPRPCLAALRFRAYLQDMLTLDVFQWVIAGFTVDGDIQGQIVRSDDRTLRNKERAMDDVLEFAHVSRLKVRGKRLDRRFTE